MKKLKMHSPDFTDKNIAKLAELFPNCVTEKKETIKDAKGGEKVVVTKAIDWDLLKQELSNNIVEGPQERYHLNWPGKREALLTANAPIAKTLRPCREESVNFDTTENLFIEGDNLDALKLLQETYLGKVKMIYIDPPYNTGNDFIYADNFAKSTGEYLSDSEQRDEEGNRLVANTESNGRFHSDWLSMMYPRLKLARNLLTDDGVIVIHIDEHEYPNLEKLLTEIFGDENNLGTVVWDKRNPKGDAVGISQQHELISFYCKNFTTFRKNIDFKKVKDHASVMLKKVANLITAEKGEINNLVRKKYKEWLNRKNFSGGDKGYSLIDNNGDIFQSVSMAWPNKKISPDDYRVPLMHPATGKKCPMPERGWRYPLKTMEKLLRNNQILFGKDETTQPRRKYLLKENLNENIPSLLYFGGSDDALLTRLGVWFDTPKVVDVSKKLILPICKGGDIILDFFAGSATTAHAVMQLNAEDDGKRKFIMVQLPEVCDEKTEAFKAGYKTIAEISKERIRRAGKKIKEENTASNLDIGFRVLKVDSSNMADIYYPPDAIEQGKLALQTENIKGDRSTEDLLFHVLLDWGVDLTLPITKESIKGHEVFFVDGNALAACFVKDGQITEDFCKELARRGPLRVVFRDSGFKDDSVKINVEQIFKLLSPHTDVKCI